MILYSTSRSWRSDQAGGVVGMSTFEYDNVAIVVLCTGFPEWSHCATITFVRADYSEMWSGERAWCVWAGLYRTCEGGAYYMSRGVSRTYRFCFFVLYHVRRPRAKYLDHLLSDPSRLEERSGGWVVAPARLKTARFTRPYRALSSTRWTPLPKPSAST